MSIYTDVILEAHPTAGRSRVEHAFKELERIGYDAMKAYDAVDRMAATGGLDYDHHAGHADPTGNEVVARDGRGAWWQLEHMHGFMASSVGIKPVKLVSAS